MIGFDVVGGWVAGCLGLRGRTRRASVTCSEESERVPATGSFAARLNKEGGAHQDREQRPARSRQT